LTAKEFDLLELFLRHPGQVFTREMIYEHIWDYDFGGESNIIEVYVRYLRTKLGAQGRKVAPDPDRARGGLCPARKLRSGRTPSARGGAGATSASASRLTCRPTT
jgi:hypothetical protein